MADSTKELIGSSTDAYKKIYPIISKEILRGKEVLIETIDFQQIL